jgi:hypothetical protein
LAPAEYGLQNKNKQLIPTSPSYHCTRTSIIDMDTGRLFFSSKEFG